MLDVLVCFFVARLNLSDDGQDILGLVIVDLQWRVCRSLFGGDSGGVVGGFACGVVGGGFLRRFECLETSTGCQQHGRDSSDGEQRCLKSSEIEFLSSHTFFLGSL